ncbi:MAG: hypothetical protein KGK18_21160, partial [Burkholderiales bacterium]|nr:hypothetical protein [Burkholderiales bacterium]
MRTGPNEPDVDPTIVAPVAIATPTLRRSPRDRRHRRMDSRPQHVRPGARRTAGRRLQRPVGRRAAAPHAGLRPHPPPAKFVVALRRFLQLAGTTPFWRALHRSKDPTPYTVLAEDSAALVGLLVAATGIALSHRFDMPELDGAASIVIGLLLAGVAVLPIRESRGLLIGEGGRPETARAIRANALAQPRVRDIGRVLSMYIGPDDVLLTMDLDVD